MVDLQRARKEEKTEVTTTATDHIPGEILHDILLRLPTKYLVRFKAVCKSWRDLISDPQFLNAHCFSLANKNKETNVNYLHMSEGPRFHAFDRSLSLTSINSEVSEIKTVKLNYSFHPHQLDSIVLGSCNGLLLVGISYETYLWNPSTGESRILCSNCWLRYRNEPYISGLGYDSSLDEYKAIIFTDYYSDDEGDIEYGDDLDDDDECYYGPSHMFIFSSRTGYWKQVDWDHQLPCEVFKFNSLGLTVNGFPHWVANHFKDKRFTSTKIIYFDMVDEKFKVLPWPAVSGWSYDYTISLAVLEGCLCTAHINKDDGGFDVWAMKEYGAKESWTKLFNIPLPGWTLTPLGFINSGDEIVLEVDSKEEVDSEELVTYNFKTNTYIVSMVKKFGFNAAASYVESLVSPWGIC